MCVCVCVCVYVYIYMERERERWTKIYCKELAHAVMKAEKFQDLPSATWRLRFKF